MATPKSTPTKSKNEKPASAMKPAAPPVKEAPAQAKAPSPAPKAQSQVKSNPLLKLSEDEIRTRAYEIFVSEGCQAGHDLENWLRAEKELRQEAGR